MIPRSWISFAGPSDPGRLRLFCFPYAGGGTGVFRPWRRSLAPDIGLGLVQLPGRESRLGEPGFTRMRPLIDALRSGLEPHFRGPYAFFGHSMGAIVAFELARRLQSEGQTGPAHLFVSAHRAPQRPYPRPPLHGLPDSALLGELRRMGGTPQEVLSHPELLDLVLPIIRTDMELCEEYKFEAGPKLAAGITGLCGSDDPDVSPEAMAGWAEHTTQKFDLHVVPGNHFFPNTAERDVMALLSRRLDALKPSGTMGR